MEGILRLQYHVIEVEMTACFELLIGERALNQHRLTLLMQSQRAFYPLAIEHPGLNRDTMWLLIQSIGGSVPYCSGFPNIMPASPRPELSLSPPALLSDPNAVWFIITAQGFLRKEKIIERH